MGEDVSIVKDLYCMTRPGVHIAGMKSTYSFPSNLIADGLLLPSGILSSFQCQTEAESP